MSKGGRTDKNFEVNGDWGKRILGASLWSGSNRRFAWLAWSHGRYEMEDLHDIGHYQVLKYLRQSDGAPRQEVHSVAYSQMIKDLWAMRSSQWRTSLSWLTKAIHTVWIKKESFGIGIGPYSAGHYHWHQRSHERFQLCRYVPLCTGKHRFD